MNKRVCWRVRVVSVVDVPVWAFDDFEKSHVEEEVRDKIKDRDETLFIEIENNTKILSAEKDDGWKDYERTKQELLEIEREYDLAVKRREEQAEKWRKICAGEI